MQDLTGGNVLLTSSSDNPHGFCAKIGDFGLSRLMGNCSNVDTNTYGTLTHMPPEVVVSGQVSAAADVYSFGVLLYEMIIGERAWAGLSHVQARTAHQNPVFGYGRVWITAPQPEHDALRKPAALSWPRRSFAHGTARSPVLSHPVLRK